MMSKAGHLQKAWDRYNQVNRLLKSGNLSPRDQQIARFVVRQLGDALGLK